MDCNSNSSNCPWYDFLRKSSDGSQNHFHKQTRYWRVLFIIGGSWTHKGNPVPHPHGRNKGCVGYWDILRKIDCVIKASHYKSDSKDPRDRCRFYINQTLSRRISNRHRSKGLCNLGSSAYVGSWFLFGPPAHVGRRLFNSVAPQAPQSLAKKHELSCQNQLGYVFANTK